MSKSNSLIDAYKNALESLETSQNAYYDPTLAIKISFYTACLSAAHDTLKAHELAELTTQDTKLRQNLIMS